MMNSQECFSSQVSDQEYPRKNSDVCSRPGRPRRASQALLQEAAFELFQLHGYRGTSVAQIAKTAGFSRATFFNCFASKAELFWVETDELILKLRDYLRCCLADDPLPTLGQAVLGYAAQLGGDSIPWALQNYRLIAAADELIASGATRALTVTRLFEHYLRQRASRTTYDQSSESTRSGNQSAADRAHAAHTTASLLTALTAWVDAGARRGDLSEHFVHSAQF